MAGPVTLLRPGHVHLAWAGGPDTYDARVDALGAAVVAHYKLAEGTGATTLTDRKGAKHGSLHNTGGIDYQLDAAVQLDQAGHSLALLGGGAPGHATVVTPMQSAAFTIDVAVQLQHKAKHIVAALEPTAAAPGSFSMEVIDDGAGGLKPRFWSVDDGGNYVIYEGTNAGTVPVATGCKLTYVRGDDGSQRFYVDGTEIAATTAQAPPASWPVHPAGTWYFGVYVGGTTAPLHGVVDELVLAEVALSAGQVGTLALAQTAAWQPLAADNEPLLILAPQSTTYSGPAAYVAQASYINTLPFDGLCVTPAYFWSNPGGGTSLVDYNWDPASHTRVADGGSLPYTYADAFDELQPFQDAFGSKKNFLMMWNHRMPDMFDPTWDDYIAQQAIFARVANDLGFHGITYDNEEYPSIAAPNWGASPPLSGIQWHYQWINSLYQKYHVGNPWGHTIGGEQKNEAQYIAQARVRGNEFMTAIKNEFAGRQEQVPIFIYHGLYWAFKRFGPTYNWTDANGNQGIWYWDNDENPWGLFPSWVGWALFGGFMSGMMQAAAGSNIKLIDGGELYRYYTSQEFAASYDWRKNRLPTDDAGPAGFGWLQPGQDWGEVGVDFMMYDNDLAVRSQALIEDIAYWCMTTGDKYSFIYTEMSSTDSWTNPSAPTTGTSSHKYYVTPLANGRARAKPARGY